MTRQPQIRQGFYPIFLYYRLLQKIIFPFFATIAQVELQSTFSLLLLSIKVLSPVLLLKIKM